jgi:hypothetical protein
MPSYVLMFTVVSTTFVRRVTVYAIERAVSGY